MNRLARFTRGIASMARVPPSDPLVVIVGATGTGKSQLAVEIAKRHNGEIVNGDAMQLYEGLPVITNKITLEEQEGIPHHLLSCIGLHEQTWVVSTFVQHALQKIKEIRSRGRLPILVGGTHYYSQSLLFQDRLTEAPPEFVDDPEAKWPILKASNEELMAELRKVDPLMASRWHPNDRRKIQRSLEIFLQTGRKASEVYMSQRSKQSTDESGDSPTPTASGMRFDTLLFWVHSETQALCERLEKRVDRMVDHGLLQEVETLEAFAKNQALAGTPVEDTKGIWVSIGYKEFKDYIQACHASASDETLDTLKAAALEKTKIATRQYSKRQIKWIRIKLLNALQEEQSLNRMYLLDGSDAVTFDETVVSPALQITTQFLDGESLPQPSSLSTAAQQLLLPKRDYDFGTMPHLWQKQHCEVCDVTSVTPDQWTMHVKSKAHKKLSSIKKRKERDFQGAEIPQP